MINMPQKIATSIICFSQFAKACHRIEKKNNCLTINHDLLFQHMHSEWTCCPKALGLPHL